MSNDSETRVCSFGSRASVKTGCSLLHLQTWHTRLRQVSLEAHNWCTLLSILMHVQQLFPNNFLHRSLHPKQLLSPWNERAGPDLDPCTSFLGADDVTGTSGARGGVKGKLQRLNVTSSRWELVNALTYEPRVHDKNKTQILWLQRLGRQWCLTPCNAPLVMNFQTKKLHVKKQCCFLLHPWAPPKVMRCKWCNKNIEFDLDKGFLDARQALLDMHYVKIPLNSI